jgi:hypothetical protein
MLARAIASEASIASEVTNAPAQVVCVGDNVALRGAALGSSDDRDVAGLGKTLTAVNSNCRPPTQTYSRLRRARGGIGWRQANGRPCGKHHGSAGGASSHGTFSTLSVIGLHGDPGRRLQLDIHHPDHGRS